MNVKAKGFFAVSMEKRCGLKLSPHLGIPRSCPLY